MASETDIGTPREVTFDPDKMTIASFDQALASKAAVPGGGGASALVGAIGTALGQMVGELTVGKKKYAAVEEDMKDLIRQAERLRGQLEACVEKDAKAFEPLSRAYTIPKDDPERGPVMERCLRDAATVPMEILELCCQAIELHGQFAEKGSVLAVSDAATGAAMCQAAMRGAAVNVKVNTASMADRDYAQALNARVDEAVERYDRRAGQIYDSIYRRFS